MFLFLFGFSSVFFIVIYFFQDCFPETGYCPRCKRKVYLNSRHETCSTCYLGYEVIDHPERNDIRVIQWYPYFTREELREIDQRRIARQALKALENKHNWLKEGF